MGDTAVLALVLTLLPQSLRNICHGKRAPWSKGAFALTQGGCFCASVVSTGSCVAYVRQRVLDLHQVGAHHLCKGDRCTCLCAGGWGTAGEGRVLREKGERNTQLLAL